MLFRSVILELYEINQYLNYVIEIIIMYNFNGDSLTNCSTRGGGMHDECGSIDPFLYIYV